MQDLIDRILFWGSTVLAAATLVLMAVSMVVESGNADRQAALAQRADFIAAMAQRGQNSPLVRDLVTAARKQPNASIRALLTKYGIAFAAPAPAASAAAPAPPATAPAKR